MESNSYFIYRYNFKNYSDWEKEFKFYTATIIHCKFTFYFKMILNS
jgi:hypothetical protein